MTKLAIRPQRSEFVVKDPGNNFKETDYKFYLVSTSSPEFYNAVHGLVQAGESDDDVTFSQKSLAACIVGWNEGFVLDDEGNNIEYSPEEALKIVTDPENSWIINQIRTHIENLSNFFCKEEKGLKDTSK